MNCICKDGVLLRVFDNYRQTNVFLKSDIKKIGDRAFVNSKWVYAVVIPKSVTEIGRRAFANSRSLQIVIMPESIEKIGSEAFMNCQALRRFVIPSKVAVTGDIFKNCKNLERLVFRRGVTIIPENVVKGCDSLREIVIPKSVTCVGNGVFDNTPWFKEYPKDLFLVGDGVLLDYRGSEKQVRYPAKIRQIAAGAFRDNKNVEEVLLSVGLKIVSDEAFAGCSSLKTVLFPAGIQSVGRNIFRGCTSLESISVCGFKFDVSMGKWRVFDLKNVVDLVQNENCKSPVPPCIKNQFIIRYILKNGIAEDDCYLRNYAKENIVGMAKILIAAGNFKKIKILFENYDFVNSHNLGELIEYAYACEREGGSKFIRTYIDKYVSKE